jgi:O-antigen/teichoic acid export membrane protein
MKSESIKANFIYQSGYQILTILLPMLTSPYIARVLGADGIGVYSYTYSIVSYFVIFAKLGLHNYGNRCVASIRDDQKKLNQTFSDLYSLHVIVSVLILAAYLFYVSFFVREYKSIFIIQGLYLIGQLLDINWFYFGIEKFKLTVTRNTAIKILTVFCVFLFVRTKNDLWKYVLILAAGSAISESLVWFFLRRFVKFVCPDVHSYKKHIKPLLILFIPSIAVSVYKVMDKVMLGSMSSTFEVGLYENAEKIINISLGFVTALGTVMLPRMSNLVATGHVNESKQMIQKSSRFILILSYAMCFGIIGVSGIFPVVFWGNEFEGCGILLIGLAVSLPFTAIANVARTQILIPQHREKAFVVAVCIGAIVNFIINLICILQFAAFGAVIGTICAEGVACIIQLVSVQKDVSIWKYVIQSFPFLIIGILMAAVVKSIGYNMGTSVITLLVQVIVGIIFYCSISLVYMILSHDELVTVITLKIKNWRR